VIIFTKNIINFFFLKIQNHAALLTQDWHQVQLQHHSVGTSMEEFCNLGQFFISFHKTEYLSGGRDNNPMFEVQKELK